MINESLKSKGTVTLVLTAKDGTIKDKLVSNTIVNAGKLFMTSRLFSDASDTFTYHVGVGGDPTAVAVTQVGLVAPLGNRVPSITPILAQTTIADDSIQLEASFGTGATTLEIKEAGLFLGLTGINMIARTTFGLITKNPDDTLTITWKLQQT